jgi:hypothetical protein
MIDKLEIAKKALLKIVHYDIEKETGYNDNLARANAYYELKRIAEKALEGINKNDQV